MQLLLLSVTEKFLCETVSNVICVVLICPFRSYLCERPRDSTLGAHSRYHPEDLKSSEVRALMNEAKDKSSEEKERVFLELCRQFRPAFRYFFLETFSDPSDWLDARIAYTRGELSGLGWSVDLLRGQLVGCSFKCTELPLYLSDIPSIFYLSHSRCPPLRQAFIFCQAWLLLLW